LSTGNVYLIHEVPLNYVNLVFSVPECEEDYGCDLYSDGVNSERDIYFKKSRDSAVGIATGYGLDDLGVGVRIPIRARIFTSPCRPDRLWGPPNLLPNLCREL
jgi:hypothetical protein